MKKSKVKKLAEKLYKDGSISFVSKDRLIMVCESLSECGWMVDVYYLSEFINGDELTSYDGGLCTGCAKDAVEFML